MNAHEDIMLKDRWNFHLSFGLPEDQQHHKAKLERLVAGVDMGTEDLTVLGGHRNNTLVIWMYDDEAGDMMRSVRAIAQETRLLGSIFSISVAMLEHRDHNMTEEYVFNDCAIVALQHSLLTFAPDTDEVNLTAIGPQSPTYKLSGTIKSPTNKAVAMKLLLISFGSMEHVFHNVSN